MVTAGSRQKLAKPCVFLVYPFLVGRSVGKAGTGVGRVHLRISMEFGVFGLALGIIRRACRRRGIAI